MESDRLKHVGEERLEAYARHSLTEEESAEIEEHLLFCSTCLDQLEAVERYGRAMRGAAARIMQEESRAPDKTRARDRAWFRTPAPIWAGVFAMGVLILMVGLNLQERPGAPIDVELQAVRGTSTGEALSGHPLNLRMDARGVPQVPNWQIQIVDENGSLMWSGLGTSSVDMIRARVEKTLPPGVYFVRLIKNASDTVREYQLVLNKEPAPR